MADSPRLVLIPVYAVSDPELWGYSFTPGDLGDPPAAWAWVRDGFTIEPEPGSKRFVIREPGRQSTRYAHELYHEAQNGNGLPLDLGPSDDA
jgi:hypothetical protein